MHDLELENAKIKKRHSLNKKRIEKIIRQLLVEIGENPNREGLIDTPRRISEMYEEIFGGYRMDSQLDITFSEESDAIIAKDINFYSICEHHMLPFFGKITVAYIPSGKVFGLSKLARLVEKYSRRLQIQERLTKEIANEIMRMGVKGSLIVAEGEHFCMKMRGVKTGSLIMTMAYRGVLQQKELRENVLSVIYTSKPELHSI